MHIEGLRIETAEKEPTYSEDGIPEIRAGTKAVIRLFGTGITPDTLITFTDIPAERGTVCDKIKSNEFSVSIHGAWDGRGEKLQEDLFDLSLYLGGKYTGNHSDRSRSTSSGITILRMRETAEIW